MNIIMIILQISLAIGFILFWIYFFLVDNKDPDNSEIYLAFERSFPIPDLGWIVPTLFISAICNLINEKISFIFSLISGGSLIFLGLLDLSFNIQQKKLKTKTGLLFSFIINIICLVFGAIFIFYGWMNL